MFFGVKKFQGFKHFFTFYFQPSVNRTAEDGSEIDSTNFSNPMFFKAEGIDTTLRSAPDIQAPSDSITLSQSDTAHTNGHLDSSI